MEDEADCDTFEGIDGETPFTLGYAGEIILTDSKGRICAVTMSADRTREILKPLD